MAENGNLGLSRHMVEEIHRMRECLQCSDEVVMEGVEGGLRWTVQVCMSLENNSDPFCSPYLQIVSGIDGFRIGGQTDLKL